MRFIRPLALSLVAVAGLATAASAEYVPYSQLRAEHPSIDAAVAALPNSDFNGTMNRISALFTRSTVRNLASGAGNSGLLPANFEPQMRDALDDLHDDMSTGWSQLTPEQQATLIQVVNVIVNRRLVDLYAGYDQPQCIPTPEHPCPDVRPALIRQLDSIDAAFRPDLTSLIVEYNASNDPDIDLPLPAITTGNLQGQLDALRGTVFLVQGVESIDG